MEPSKIENTKSSSNSQSGFRAYHPSGRNNPKHLDIATPSSSHTDVKKDLEAVILASNVPIDLNETEEITVNGERGIWANKKEVTSWRGNYPISKYPINEDLNPKIIHKKTQQRLVYHQEVAIRYLRPPTPPAPGDILIKQEDTNMYPPAPPLVIRQQPPKPSTPPPLVVREAPPPPPPKIGRKIITILGKKIPPPPRKVIIERLPQLPPKPQSIIIERWLPYKQIKRKVIFARVDKNNIESHDSVKPKNIIVQWDQPKVEIKKEFKDLGIVRANPNEYMQRFGSTLKKPDELPQFVKDIRPPEGVLLAAEDTAQSYYELEGDVYALNLIDLEREGLSEYKCQLKPVQSSTVSNLVSIENSSIPKSINHNLLNELYNSMNIDRDNKVNAKDADKILSRFLYRITGNADNYKICHNYFYKNIDPNQKIDFIQFKNTFESLIMNNQY